MKKLLRSEELFEEGRMMQGRAGRACEELRLDDFAGLDATGADAQLLVGGGANLDLDGTQIDIPAPTGDVVRVRYVIAELRAFAADFANLSHDSLQKTWVFRPDAPEPDRWPRLCVVPRDLVEAQGDTDRRMPALAPNS